MKYGYLQILGILAVLVSIFLFQNCSGGLSTGNSAQNTGGTLSGSSLITITKYPSDLTNTASISFTIGSVPAGIQSVLCQLDSQAAADCSSGSVSYLNLYVLPYTHTVTITVTDKANNPQSASYTWSISSPGLSQQIQAAQLTAENSTWCTGAQNDIRPFYWEIGNSSGPVSNSTGDCTASDTSSACGSQTAATQTAVLRSSVIGIDSASKFIFATFVTQGLGNYVANNNSTSFKTSSAFLHMAAGYSGFQDDSCSPNLLSPNTSSIANLSSVLQCANSCCVMNIKNQILDDPSNPGGNSSAELCGDSITHATDLSATGPNAAWVQAGAHHIACNYDWVSTSNGVFSYSGGDFQRYAAAGSAVAPISTYAETNGVWSPIAEPYGTNYGLGIGALQGYLSSPNTPPNLAWTVMNTLGLPSLYGKGSFIYGFAQLAGGVDTSSVAYAGILQQIVNASSPLAIRSYLGKDPLCAWTATQSFGACNANYSPINYQNLHYSYGHWVEDQPAGQMYDVTGTTPTQMAPIPGDGAFSSPGLHGYYPWVDATKNYYGIVARTSSSGAGSGKSSVGSGWGSLLCGRQIRAAFFTGLQQQ